MLELIEGAVDAVKSYLEANMSTKITALNTEYRDFELANIKQYYIAELAAIPELPAMLVLGGYTLPEREAANYIRAKHYLKVVALASDQDAQQLRRRLYRYVRAIVELLREARSSAGWSYVIVFDRFDYSPVYTSESSFYQDAQVIAHFNKSDTV